MLGFLHIVILICVLAAGCCGDKLWVPNTNFENAHNWDVGRTPCEGDSLEFPPDSPTVFIQTNATVTEIVLPRDGVFVLGDFVSLSAPDPDDVDPSCNATSIQFMRTQLESFFAPDNWCETDHVRAGCRNQQTDRLASERVPCVGELTAFPRDRSFLVDLETGVDIQLSQLLIGRHSYDTSTLGDYLRSEGGAAQFKHPEGGQPTVITVKERPPCGPSGCACGNDQGAVLEHICAAMDTCSNVTCTVPVKPMGACCPLCGAVIELEYQGSGPQSFQLASFEALLQRRYLRHTPGVRHVVSKTSLDFIQVVLTDGGSGEAAQDVARKIQSYLQSDIRGSKTNGVTHVHMAMSSLAIPERSLSTTKLAGIIVVIVVIVITLLSLSIYLICSRRKLSPLTLPKFKPPSFSLKTPASLTRAMARLRKRSSCSAGGDVELTPKGTLVFNDFSRSFENPLYDSTSPGIPLDLLAETPAGVAVRDSPGVLSLTDEGFINPMAVQQPNNVMFVNAMEGGLDEPVVNLGRLTPPAEEGSPAKPKPMQKVKYLDDHTPTLLAPIPEDEGWCNPMYGCETPFSDENDNISADITDMFGSVAMTNPMFGIQGPVEDILTSTAGEDNPNYFRLEPAYPGEPFSNESQI